MQGQTKPPSVALGIQLHHGHHWLHLSEYQITWVTASQDFILEFYRQICVELEMDTASFSRVVRTTLIRKQTLEIAQNRKKKPVLIT
ncbi:hypothetical protein DFAR_4040040 [Desulfarculales bacterium]